MDNIFVGIDLGTTNTFACHLKRGRPELIRFQGSGKMIPSVLYVDNGKVFVGREAELRGRMDPLNVIRSSKTYMGDPTKVWEINGKVFTPTDVAAEILKEVKAQILKKFKCPPETKINAVITVPAYFAGNQKDETKKAGKLAGLNVLQIITEPMAAAVAAIRFPHLDEKIFVMNLSDIALDLSILKADNQSHTYRVLDISGGRTLGGDDFDSLLYEYLIGIIQDDLGLDLSEQKTSGLDYNEYYNMIARVREAAKIAKLELNEATTCQIVNYRRRNYDFSTELTREEFNDICRPLFDKITSRIKNFIDGSNAFTLDEISTIILAGSGCNIPKVREEIEKFFGKRVLDPQIDSEVLVAAGAGFVAESMRG